MEYVSTNLLDKLDNGVGKKLGACIAELLEGDEARIRVAEDTVAVSAPMKRRQNICLGVRLNNYLPGHDLAALESPPEELLNVFVRNIVADFLTHVELPSQHFLVRKTRRRM